jgi:hypothetical protein
MSNIRISQLPTAGAITGAELVPIVQNGVTVQTTASALAGAITAQTQTYLTVNNEPTLAQSRQFGYVGGTGLVLADTGAQGVLSIGLTGALALFNALSTGFVVKNATATLVNRLITVSGSGIAVTNGSGVSGNPTVALSGLTANIASQSGTGLLAIAGATATPVTLTGSTNITVANGNGSGGAPTVSLANSPTVSGTMTAGSFSGAGTGLTGTAAALSIGGNAATATTAVTVPVRTTVLADGTSVTVNVDTTDLAVQTNTQTAGTLTVNAPTGTPINGQKFILRLQCTNAQTFSWDAIFAGSTDLILPTATTGTSKYDYVGFIYNSTAAKWQLLAKVFGF